MDPVTPDFAAAACQGEWHPRPPAGGLTAIGVDSRHATPHSLFFALPGARADGHDFLAAAAAAGAAAVVRADFPPDKLPAAGHYLRVADVLMALGRLAAAYRATLPARIVGVTGSIGKTSTKEMIADLLHTVGPTGRTAGNHNNEIGLPLSLAALDRNCRFGVIEAGISRPGELAHLRDILRPDLAVITRIGPVHAEFFESVHAIAEEKATLLAALPGDGFAVLDRDDEFYPVLRARCAAPVITCSLRQREVDYAGDLQADGHLWVCEAATGETSVLPVPPPTSYMAETVLRAVAVARRCGAAWADMAAALARVQPVGMRWAVSDWHGITIINDGYNANPISVRAAARAYLEWPVRGRRFLAVGPMLELGRLEAREHEAWGRHLAAGQWAGVALLPWKVTNGAPDPATQALAAGLQAGGWPAEKMCLAPDAAAAAAWLQARCRAGDALLLKASRDVRIESVLAHWQKES